MLYDSVILKPIYYIIRILEVSYTESFTKKLFDLIKRLAMRVNNAYENSFTHRIMDKLVKTLIVLFTNSSIWRFVSGQGRLGKWWESSILFRILNGMLTVPSNLLKKLYRRNEAFFKESIFLRLLSLLIHRFEVIIGLMLFVTVITPDKMWTNTYSTVIAGLLLFLFFICTIAKRNSHFNFKALDFTLILFALIIGLSWVTSINRGLSMRFLIFHMTSFLFVLIIVSSIRNEKSLGLFIEMLLTGVTLIALYGLWQFFSGSVAFDPSLTSVNLNEGMPGRVYATMSNPNNFAELLVMMLPFYVAVIFNARTFVKKATFFVLALPSVVVLFCTGARSAWIAFAVSVFVFTFLKNKRLIPLILVAGVFFIPFLPEHVIRRVQTLFNLENDTSAQYRMKILQTAWPMFKEYILTGVGLGTDVFMNIVSRYHQYTSKTPVHTHVLYMQIWIETGILGIIAFIWFVFRTIKSAVIDILDSKNRYFTNVLIAGVSSLLGILSMAAVEYIWYYQRIMLFFWIDVAIVLTALSIIKVRRNRLSDN